MAEAPARRATTQKTQGVIIHAALAEFAEKGFDGARVDEIALRTGLNKNVLYHHFGSKDGLFVAVLEHTYATIRAMQNEMQLRTLDPVAGMQRLVVFTGRIWVQYPEFQRLLMSENLIGGKHLPMLTGLPDIYNPLLDTLMALLTRGVDEGAFREGIDPVDLYISLTSLTAHYVNHQHTFEAIFRQKLMTPARVKQRLDHAAEMIVRYCRA